MDLGGGPGLLHPVPALRAPSCWASSPTTCGRTRRDHSKGDWKDGVPLQPSYEQQEEIFQAFVDRYPNLKCIARHVRYAHSGSENSLKAFMWYEGHTFESRLFTFTILDRVGGGDAFASGLIYAMMHQYKPMDMLNFAVASSAIKHTIHGDGNITDDAETIRSLMNMNYDIKRVRSLSPLFQNPVALGPHSGAKVLASLARSLAPQSSRGIRSHSRRAAAPSRTPLILGRIGRSGDFSINRAGASRMEAPVLPSGQRTKIPGSSDPGIF